MATFNTYITEGIVEYQIQNMVQHDQLNIVITKVEDQAFHRKKLTGSIVFKRSDNFIIYDIIKGFTEDKTKYCEVMTFRIEKICGDGTVISNYLDGDFTANKVKISYCKCYLEIDPRTIDDYSCLFENWTDNVKFGSASRQPYTAVRFTLFTCTINFIDTLANFIGAGIPAPPSGRDHAAFGGAGPCVPFGGIAGPPIIGWFQGTPLGPGNPAITGWLQYYYMSFTTVTFPGVSVQISTAWQTETTVSVPTPPGAGWVNTGGNNWQRRPYPTGLMSDNSRGLLFNTALETIVADSGCFTGVVSDFFNINPDATAPVNSAYDYALVNLHDLLILQTSDAKFPAAASPADTETFQASLEDILNDLQVIFNIIYFSEGANLRIEHVSYLTTLTPIDICKQPCFIINKLDVPDKEEFSFKDKVSGEFNGSPIVYGAPCGEGVKSRSCRILNTDIGYIEANPDSVNNDGFILVSTVIDASVRYLNDYNRPLSYEQLHPALWVWDRYFFEGDVNGSNVVFQTTKKIRETTELFCTCQCDELTGQEIISTDQGDGQIQELTENLRSNSIKIKLNLE